MDTLEHYFSRKVYLASLCLHVTFFENLRMDFSLDNKKQSGSSTQGHVKSNYTEGVLNGKQPARCKYWPVFLLIGGPTPI